ncbi:uncharacterized protein LACBIDRAFT_331914 [Laccaria bicolor S238N-H82]|uniref:Predicted protein n=1 Tax=Laccaria bicolor (strain S238N-H82 / ATCC MYA-4686) TaxID=486041 RepID=B0DR12_LACBS|nr:uncharacterized protein LACBIDRAFT_331914 [Laccaria bicolor S238N-H82]EDR02919.1 predicted protein [Laccaria bicolor S238N-H82]|eukprot:XP_001886342.1 predicted protein [Laccaria bicolor S238N-H82]
MWFAFVPGVLATGSTTPLPDIPFQAFSQFILTTFNPEISLETVLLVFFSLVENPDLLNLHACQKHPKVLNEKKIIASSWMKSLGRALNERLDSDLSMLFQLNEFVQNSWETALALNLDAFSELLGLTPYKQGIFNKKLQKHSVRDVASTSNTTFETQPNIAIDDLTQHAFAVLVRDTERIPDTLDVNMLTLDGVVMGPQICAFDNCTNDLLNAHGGALCATHEALLANKCRMVGCSNDKIQGTQACKEHVADWKKSVQDRSKATINGIRPVLQHPGERQEWQNIPDAAIQQPHDDEVDANEAENPQPSIKQKMYFSPNLSYCVETACAPCGVVIAWTKFPKSESPTNIFNWLDEIFPNKEDRPAYICIDKACQVFKTAVESTSKNFNWFIHTMLIYHVKHVLAKMASMKGDGSTDEENSDEESSNEESSDEEGSDEKSSDKDSNEEESNEESDSTNSSDHGMHLSD